MDWVLLTAAGILLIGFAIGLYRGAVKIAISLLTTMVTLVLVTLATPHVSGLITRMTPLDDMIQEQVTAAMVTAATSRAEEGNIGLTEESVRQVLDAAGVSEEALGEFGISIEDIVNERVTGDQLAQYGISSNILDGLKARGVAEDVVENAEIPRDMQVAAIESADLPEVFKDLLSTNNNSAIYEELGAEPLCWRVPVRTDYSYCSVPMYFHTSSAYIAGNYICFEHRGRASGAWDRQPPDRRRGRGRMRPYGALGNLCDRNTSLCDSSWKRNI